MSENGGVGGGGLNYANLISSELHEMALCAYNTRLPLLCASNCFFWGEGGSVSETGISVFLYLRLCLLIGIRAGTVRP